MLRFAAITATLFGLTAGPAVAQQQGSDKAREHVLQALKQSAEDQAACRAEAWRASHTPDWMIVFPAGQVETAAGFMKNCVVGKPSQFEQTDVRLYGGDTAIVTAQFRRSGADGAAGPLNRITQVWVLQDGTWRNAISHVTRIQQGGQ